MRTSKVILFVWLPTVLILALVLALALGTEAVLAFAASLIMSTAVVLTMLKIVEVESYEHLIVRRGGRYFDTGIRGGRVVLVRGLDSAIRVDMRPQTEFAEDEECFTVDGINLGVSHFLLWQVADPLRLIVQAPSRVGQALQGMACAALRREVSRMPFHGVSTQRANLETAVTRDLVGPGYLQQWGIQLVTFGIKGVQWPDEIVQAYRALVRAFAERQKSAVEANAFEEMKQVVGDNAWLLQILRTISQTFGNQR